MLRLSVAAAVRFLKSESGPTAVEYAVMLALIIVVCAAGVSAVGSATDSSFGNANLGAALTSGGS
jgi:pilus assembly protein Flp/PilA